ncbi:MAG TPA: hypothetical protein VN317_02550 [Candidatus Methanoperedens sp.]|nr:hypothetical protein [Candidatus Methanoperedens sp.]
MHRPVAILLAAALIAPALAAPAPAAEDAQGLWRRNRRLAAEAALAATPKPYFLVDFEARRISLLTRGLTLFELPVAEFALWGRRPAIGPTAVEARDALARPEIRPGDDQPDKPMNIDDQLLELVDMPARYRMRLAGDIEIDVLSLAEGRWPLWRQRLEIWRWRLSRPLLTLRQRRERRETTTVLLVLRREDAQRLYWSFFEGLDGILIPPR